jgi:hypothetical protein
MDDLANADAGRALALRAAATPPSAGFMTSQP